MMLFLRFSFDSVPQPEPPSWCSVAEYAGPTSLYLRDLPAGTSSLYDHLDEITGAAPLDCGWLEPQATASRMQAALTCASNAARAGRPFRVIRSEWGIDSWVPHGLVRGSLGPVLRFTDDDLPGSDKFRTEPCPSPALTKDRYRGLLVFSCTR